MRNYNDDISADVAVLPKSSSLMYSSDYNPRDGIEINQALNLDYIETYSRDNYLIMGDYRIERNGIDNNFPHNWRKLCDSNHLSHGVNRTAINLLASAGTGLYQEIKEGKYIVRDWILDDEISDWLDSFEYKTKVLPQQLYDWQYVENKFTIFSFNKGYSRGLNYKSFISKLTVAEAQDARLEFPDAKGRRKHIFLADWLYGGLGPDDLIPYLNFDIANPYKHKGGHSMIFTKMPSFGSSTFAYGRPPDVGATLWLEILRTLPNFHLANLKERSFKWIISVSQNYYKAICEAKNWTLISKEFIEWKAAFRQTIDEFLAAPDGDKIQTRLFLEHLNDAHTLKDTDLIKITKLEDDYKELSEVGINLYDIASTAFIAAKSMNPQLANIHLKNHALSGSELSEAYEGHIKTHAPMMRELLLYDVNLAIKLNWPNKKIKVGFIDQIFENQKPKTKTEEKQKL